MERLAYWLTNIVLTLVRVLPVPCRTGLVSIGRPGRDAPVLLTGNYLLTVERVKHALRGLDVWLLVANSRGVNVWCAAAGGHLTNHDVIAVLKTSGIEQRVDHRRLILPQLAATGIEAGTVRQRTGWQVVWGPVRATDIARFLKQGYRKTRSMRSVSFDCRQRVEMAAAWAFPISLLALLVLPFWKEGLLALVGLIWGLSLLIFLGFPLYEQQLRPRESVGFVLFNFGPRGVLLVFWGLFLLMLLGYGYAADAMSWVFMARWSLASFVVLLILGLDLTGSTPMYKSGLHEDRWLKVVLDESRCQGAGYCEQVCPVNVFEVDPDRRLASLPGAAHCVQCGACIVQCPCDALSFRGPSGIVLAPQTIRRFKLNLLGKRAVRRAQK